MTENNNHNNNNKQDSNKHGNELDSSDLSPNWLEICKEMEALKELRELKELRYPIMIITICSIVLTTCAVINIFYQVSMYSMNREMFKDSVKTSSGIR